MMESRWETSGFVVSRSQDGYAYLLINEETGRNEFFHYRVYWGSRHQTISNRGFREIKP